MPILMNYRDESHDTVDDALRQSVAGKTFRKLFLNKAGRGLAGQKPRVLHQSGQKGNIALDTPDLKSVQRPQHRRRCLFAI